MPRPPEYFLSLVVAELAERLAIAQAEIETLRESLAEAEARAVDTAPALAPEDPDDAVFTA